MWQDVKGRTMPPAFVVNKPRISAAMEAALQRHMFSKVLSCFIE
jgi:hypothetical protein